MPRLKERPPIEPLWFPPKEAAQLLHKSVAQLYEEMKTGVTPFLMDGKNRRIPAAHIKERTRYPP